MSGPRREDRWLITGADGQVGASLRAVCAAEGIPTVPLGHGDLDVSDGEAVANAVANARPSVIVNCAAFTNVDGCEREESAARRVNAEGARHLAEAAGRGECLLVQLSTDYIFSGLTSVPILEDAEGTPRSAYGRTKWAGEERVRSSGCESLIVRSQWIFGRGRNFVRTILRAAREGAPLRVVEDQVGRPTWSRSLAQGIVVAVRAGGRGPLHLACEGIASWFDLAVAAIEEASQRGWVPAVPVEPVETAAIPRPASRPSFGVLDLERARKLGVRLPHWRPALRMYLDSEEWRDE